MNRILLLSALALSGCSAAQLQTTQADLTKAQTDAAALVAKGALFCAKAQGIDGTITVMLANAAGVPVSVTGQASSDVAAACKLINAIPVVPPANPGAAPVVATKTTLPPA